MAGLHGPLPTLRPWPRGQTRTARGRRGSLLLRRIGLSPTTPGRSPGALPNLTANDPLVRRDHALGGCHDPPAPRPHDALNPSDLRDCISNSDLDGAPRP